jgi:hypothetical protein
MARGIHSQQEETTEDVTTSERGRALIEIYKKHDNRF